MNVWHLPSPDDAHLHLRDGDLLKGTAADAARHLHRAVIMPNLNPPITTIAQAQAYRARILAHSPSPWSPYLTLYATCDLNEDTLREAASTPWITGVKLYPLNATTHASWGLSDLTLFWDRLAAMEALDLVLHVHGEVTDPEVDVFDREAVFIERHLVPLRQRFPKLRIVLEHTTTKEGVAFVLESGPRTAATITAHHLWHHRNALFEGGLRPHRYCLPLLKAREHQEALQRVVAQGHPRFFMGTDSAPHPKDAKEAACGCAGVYTANAPLAYYAAIFDALKAHEHLGPFVGHHAADFLGWPRSTTTCTLIKRPWRVPNTVTLGGTSVVPFEAGSELMWQHAPEETP